MGNAAAYSSSEASTAATQPRAGSRSNTGTRRSGSGGWGWCGLPGFDLAGVSASGSPIAPLPIPGSYPRRCRLEVLGRHDVIAVEYRPRLVPRDLHRHLLGCAVVHHVPDRGPAKVVEQPPGDAGAPAGRLPGPLEVLQTLA